MSTTCTSLPDCCNNPFSYELPGTPYPPLPTGAPVVSNGAITIITQTPLTYGIIATNSPTSYGASSLPAGLSINPTTGLISGTITSPILKQYSVNISATNSNGTGHGILLITVVIPIPVVTSSAIRVAPSGVVNYQIIATNFPTSYGATGLPIGLSLNTSTGIISGNVPVTLTTYSIPISATNASGTGNGTLTIKVTSPLVGNFTLSGSLTPAGATYQIAIDGAPYATLTMSQNYTALSQMKVKTTFPSPTNASAGYRQLTGTLTSAMTAFAPGSSLSVVASVTAQPISLYNLQWNGTEIPPYSHVAGGVISSTGPVNSTFDASGAPFTFNILNHIFENGGVTSNCIFESILNVP